MPATYLSDEFDDETLALLAELDVPLVAAAAPTSTIECDLDAAFGTPLALHEVWALPAETACLSLTDSSPNANRGAIMDYLARRQASLDILADDPIITTRVRERLVDFLVADVLAPTARRLRTVCTVVSVAQPERLAA